MADHQETFDQIDSASLFESAMGNEPEAQAEVVEQVAEQPRAPDGKFATKPAEPAKEVVTEQPAPVTAPVADEGAIPPWRLREMREERDAARNEAARFRAEMEQFRRQAPPATAPEPVDIFADPNGFMQQQLSPFEQRLQSLSTNTTLRLSRVMNIIEHGKEAVAEAEKAIGEAMDARDPDMAGLRAKMLDSDDPVAIAVEWHKSRSLLKETGGNLNAYRERALEEALNDPAFLQKALDRAKGQGQQPNGGQPPKNVFNIPPSIGKVPAAQASTDAGDMSNESLFANAMR